MKGKAFLKIASVFILIWGILNLIAGIMVIGGFDFFNGLLPEVQSELTSLALVRLIGVGFLEIVAAVLGFKAAHDAKKAKYCIFLGGLVFAFTVTTLFTTTSDINWISYITSNVFPILYLIGAFLRKSHQN